MEVSYSSYSSESDLPGIMQLIDSELSEPYSIYTYRYFLHAWPELCFMAHVKGELVGVIVCKASPRRKYPAVVRGYIAMLVVTKPFRKAGIVNEMKKTCHEVVLEAEVDNGSALRLYGSLGFQRDKLLPKYYLNGNSAYRLKLWFRKPQIDAFEEIDSTAAEAATQS